MYSGNTELDGIFAERKGFMMKKVLSFVMALFMVVSFAACGAKSDAGYYVLDYIKEGETELQGEALKGVNLSGFIVLDKDGTGRIYMMEEEQKLKWGDGKITIDGDSVDYTIKDNSLNIDVEEVTMRFKRSNDTPPAAK